MCDLRLSHSPRKTLILVESFNPEGTKLPNYSKLINEKLQRGDLEKQR
jgi:hypothetical protein